MCRQLGQTKDFGDFASVKWSFFHGFPLLNGPLPLFAGAILLGTMVRKVISGKTAAARSWWTSASAMSWPGPSCPAPGIPALITNTLLATT